MNYQYADLHSDTITQLHYPFENLEKNHRMVSIPKMLTGHTCMQCFSAFVPTGQYPKPLRNLLTWERFIYISKKKDCLLKKHNQVLFPILSGKDIDICLSNQKIGMIYTIEDSGIFGNDIQKIQKAYDNGVRIATLTWNHENTLGYPNSLDASIMKKGLKPFGFEVVEKMNELGIIIDVSHLSDGGFYDIANISKKPFIATHSNSRTLANKPRNLTDEMIKILAKKGGVIGLNFYPPFLKTPNEDKISTISDMVQHLKYIQNIGGTDVLAIGTDFDGITGNLEIDSPAKLPLLSDALEKANFSQTDIEKIFSKNVIRVLKDCLK